ncbi:MAG: TatD family hydrolase [Candidatus Binatia bacterium]
MLIDAHAHLDKYGSALGSALNEIAQHRIFTIGTAMDVPSYEEMRRIAEQSALVLATFGIHPKRAPDYVTRLKELHPYIEASPAVGEIGLDFHWVKDGSLYPAQCKVLEYFLAAARDQNKLVNLHTKGAEQQILDLLERYDIQRAIVHWYSGPLDILRHLAEFGVYFTVGVELLFSENIRTIAAEIPDQRLLTETDNPGGLKWLNGVTGMPGVLREVLQALARMRQKSENEMARLVNENFLRLVHHDPWLQPVRVLLSHSLQ